MPTLPKGMIKSIRVRTTHLGYRKKLLAIASTTARNTHFDCAKYGGKISVEQYFLKGIPPYFHFNMDQSLTFLLKNTNESSSTPLSSP